MKKLVLLSLLCGGFTMSVHAQNDKALWKSTGASSLSQKAKAEFGKHFKPSAYKFFSLNETSLKNSLVAVPSEKELAASRSAKIISVPGADGKMEQFSIAAMPVMAPGLSAKYSGIKTYTGQGIEDKTARIYFDVTPSGFHAMVISAVKPTYYINPVDRDNKIYIVNARNTDDRSAGFKCSVNDAFLQKGGATGKATTVTGNADDGTLRTYDLALCVNGEFSQVFLDGTEADTAEMKSKVMDVLVTCLVRANAVYERDFDVRMQYIENEDTLIFIDAVTDPWPTRPPLFGSAWNTKTQQTIDARIGADNYDIGHLLGKVPAFNDNNGNAGCIACVCTNGSKGSGFTAYYDPTLIEYTVIDYWTHEMGHQFGANHTFTFSRESGSQVQIEPGSGSTIMGYAGITGSTDVQPHSDDLFSVASIAQVSNYTETGNGNSCAAATANGNLTPVANAGADFTVPRSTPFLLAGTASDANTGDALTYIWEQIDIYENSTSNTFPSPTSTTGPVFRVFNDSIFPVRAFPAMPTVLAGQTSSQWEAIPSVARELNFRFTVKDNHVGGGNNKSDDMKVTVSAAAGPFVVTQPNTNVSWAGGSQKLITWDVASTNGAPINAANVKITLSTNGGISFNTVLAANTPNDGSQLVILPNITSTQCRIKVQALGNIFFDVSNASFSISASAPCPGQYDTNNNNNLANAVAIPLNTEVSGTIGTSTDIDFYKFTITTGGTASITLTNLPANYNLALYNAAGTVIQNATNGGTTSEEISGTLPAGNYSLRVIGVNGSFEAINCYLLKITTGTASRVFAAAPNEVKTNTGVFSIYPNPVRSALYVNIPSSASKHEIKVYDVNGKMVAYQKATQNTVKVNVGNAAAGMYFVKVTNQDGKEVYSTTFIKQ